MNIIASLVQSSLGKKYIMAITGGGLFVFAVGHMLGNLQIFLGPEKLNAYGHFLQSTPGILWPARLLLLTMVTLHIWSAARLALENEAARPLGYAGNPTPVAASYASRTMMMSGLIVAAFVGYHLLHFTVQTQSVNLTGSNFKALLDDHGHHDVYRMMIIGFSHPVVSAFYIAAMALLCLHLSHGASAMFQSLGLKSETFGPVIDCTAKVAAGLIFLGYVSIPVAVMCGWGKEFK